VEGFDMMAARPGVPAGRILSSLLLSALLLVSAVAWAPGKASVWVWQITSRGRGPGAGRPPPNRA